MRFRLLATLVASLLLFAGVETAGAQTPSSETPVSPPAPAAGPSGGYWLVRADGRVLPFGNAPDELAPSGPRVRRAAVGIARTPTGNGYWVVGADGAVGTFGDARSFGSMAGKPLTLPIVGMAATPTGNGYWLVASDGGIFAFGDARFFGSTGNIRLNKPVVGMAPTRTGRGYWMVASDGGIFAYGDARFFGSTGSMVLDQPVVSMEPNPAGTGYWLVAADGGVFSFGGVRFHGSTGGQRIPSPIVDMAVTPSGGGYWMAAASGAVYSFGTAPFHGAAAPAGSPVVGIASPTSTAWRTLLVAGDVAACDSPGDEVTAELLDQLEGTVVVPGDVVYETGTKEDYAHCYEPSWGRHRNRTRPSIGNHEYLSGGDAYWDYYGEAMAGPRQKGWYSFDVGSWQIIVLNSNCVRVGCGPDSEQQQWLQQELIARGPNVCTAVVWHHQRFSSGNFGSQGGTAPLFQTLYNYNVDLLFVGHEHNYERFAEMSPQGTEDPGRGVRQFVVGTGGRNLIPMRDELVEGSQSRQAEAFGILKVDLDEGGYRWRFVSEPGKSFTDTGRGRCH